VFGRFSPLCLSAARCRQHSPFRFEAYVKERRDDARRGKERLPPAPLTGRYEGLAILSQTAEGVRRDDVGRPERPKARIQIQTKHFSKTLSEQGRITRTSMFAPLGRSSLEVFNNFRSEVTAKVRAPGGSNGQEGCGPSFMVGKYRWTKQESQGAAPVTAYVRYHLIEAAFDNMKEIHAMR